MLSRKTILFFITFFFGILFWQLAKAEVGIHKLVSTMKDQEDVALTIYNSNLGLVKDLRTLRLPAGSVEMRFMDVASKIDPTSVHFKSLTDPAGVNIQEQSYEFDLITPQKLMEKYVGKTVTLIDRIKGGEEEVVKEAKLISANEGFIYQIGDRVHLGHPGRVVLKKIPEDLNADPTLVWLLENRQLNEQMVEVSYLTEGIKWKLDYVAVIDENDQHIDLTSWVTITNKSGATYRNASIKLIAGEVHRISPPGFAGERHMLKAGEEVKELRFEEKPFFEYHLYTLSHPTTIKDNQIKQMAFLSANALSTRKLFIFEGMPHFYWDRHPQKSSRKVMVKLKIENTKENNLGIPLPEGKIRIYKECSDGSLRFIGENKIEHIPRDKKVSLMVGSAFDIEGEHIQTGFEKLDSNTWKESFAIKIRNHKEKEVIVTVIEHLAGNWEITQSSREWIKKDATAIEFKVPVAPNGEAGITYTVVVKR